MAERIHQLILSDDAYTLLALCWGAMQNHIGLEIDAFIDFEKSKEMRALFAEAAISTVKSDLPRYIGILQELNKQLTSERLK